MVNSGFGQAQASGAMPNGAHGAMVPRHYVAAAVAAEWLDRTAVEARLGTLARGMAALDVRQARVLAWLRAQDLAPLGYPGWSVFLREHVDWGGSWTRNLVQLVRSGLQRVLASVCAGELPLVVAVRAPGMCDTNTEAEWLADAVAGTLRPRDRRRPSGASALIEPGEADSLAIWHARQKVRRLEGLKLSDREADDRMIRWWREGRSAAEIVAAALAPAPKPASAPADVSGGLDWSFADPAESFLGPWRTPGSLEEGIVALRAVQEARRERVLELGATTERLLRQNVHRRWGYRDIESFSQATMGLSARTVQRYRELGRGLRRLPELAAATKAGMSLSRVEVVARTASEGDVDRWLAVAERTPMVELERAAAHVCAGADPRALLDAYEAAMATTTGKVALASLQAPVPPNLTDRVPPELPAAARWILAIEVPAQHGFGKIKVRDRFICANPECRRPGFRNHAHHRVFREQGGSNDPTNLHTACPSCHLRLVHTDRVYLVKEGDLERWIYPDRVVIVVPGPRL